MPWWPDIPNVSEYTRPATWEDVKNLARLLNDAGVQYALVGGYAICAPQKFDHAAAGTREYS